MTIRLKAVPVSGTAVAQQEAARANALALQKALDTGGLVRIVEGSTPGTSEYPLGPVTVKVPGTRIEFHGCTIYAPKALPVGRIVIEPLIRVVGVPCEIVGSVLFSQPDSACRSAVRLDRAGLATDPGVRLSFHAWGCYQTAVVESHGAECVTFDHARLVQDGLGCTVALNVDGSSTRYHFVNGCYLANYGGGDVIEVQGGVQEVSLRDCYMAGEGRGLVTWGEGEVTGLLLDNVRFEGPGPVVDTTGTWLAESRFEGVVLGPGPGDRKDRPVIKTRANARNVLVGPTCKTFGTGQVYQQVNVTD